MSICPKCKSNNIEYETIDGSKFLICNDCGYDESEYLLEVYPDEKSSQKAKSRYSPYKSGGSRRAVKKIK